MHTRCRLALTNYFHRKQPVSEFQLPVPSSFSMPLETLPKDVALPSYHSTSFRSHDGLFPIRAPFLPPEIRVILT